ncbi:PREDICTED: uncharacterized protein LOC104610674 [Nelumbo nucifera]|uniref:Uncharacterized protein LOC104610674 n=1 Tax=Nelumbo nucifera TaxID=4432 RepID=A0A1U8BFV8_NELNU|nr:PREDICTED: uncharacterized protein LOC104610674 [Nelumbo nucifera]
MQLTAMQVQAVACEWCGGGHVSTECQVGNQFMQSPEQVDFVGNLQRQQSNSYPHAFNPGWWNHPNLSWSNQNVVKPPPQNFAQPEKKSNLEELMTKFISSAETRFQNQEASIKNLETQLGQLAQMISVRVQGVLPSNTEANPREQVQAITLRNCKELKEVEKKTQEGGKKGATLETEKEEEQSDSREEKSQKPQVPFPNRLKRHKMEKDFGKFLEIFNSLHINILFVDALAQMPHYAKFLKEILANKRKLGEVATVALNEECSLILLNKLPQKLKDPRGFTIPCTIGSLRINKALCDLGASINLIPYFVFKKLGLGES